MSDILYLSSIILWLTAIHHALNPRQIPRPIFSINYPLHFSHYPLCVYRHPLWIIQTFFIVTFYQLFNVQFSKSTTFYTVAPIHYSLIPRQILGQIPRRIFPINYPLHFVYYTLFVNCYPL